jgi:hypothetical protein
VLGVFLLPSSHIWQGLKDFLPLSKPKKREFIEEIITPVEFKKGRFTTSGGYLQKGVRQGLHVVHKVQRKVGLNRLGPSEEIIKKELPSISLQFFC